MAAGRATTSSCAELARAGTRRSTRSTGSSSSTTSAHAADLLRPAYDSLDGADGFVSVEVAPDLADDTAATIDQARWLHGEAARPNVLVKIPATAEGIPAIEQSLAEGMQHQHHADLLARAVRAR